MHFSPYLGALASLLVLASASECTLNTCSVDPQCGIEACTETVGEQTLYFYFCCADPGFQIAPGGSNRCPGCDGSKMFKRWAEIADMQAEDLKKRSLEAFESENRVPVEMKV